jgi:dinuclear metal center YbgI/SA1388 family protein
MIIKDIYDYLDSLSPFDTQEKWDNSGLLVGNMQNNIENIYLSLDLDMQTLQTIKPNSLVIVHHPIMFSTLKKINFDSFDSKIIQYLIKYDINLIAMHTNFDKSHLNSYVGKEILGFDFVSKDDFIVEAQVDMSFDKLCKVIKSKLNIKHLRIVKTKKQIKSIALTTGAGASLLQKIEADCFLTGDIKYHEAMEAKARDIALVDIGHWESERYFVEILDKILKKYLKSNNKKAIILTSKNPFNYK